jgi:hypothetical protein
MDIKPLHVALGGGIVLAFGAYWLYSKSKASAAATPAPAGAVSTPANLLKEGAVGSPADIAALSKLLSPAAASKSALGLSDSTTSNSPATAAAVTASDWYYPVPALGASVTTVVGTQAIDAAFQNYYCQPLNAQDGASGWKISSYDKENAVLWPTLRDQATKEGNLLLIEQNMVDRLKASGAEGWMPAYVVSVANLPGFLKTRNPQVVIAPRSA